MKIHHLKIKAEYALSKLQGTKPFEIRRNDRNFEVGDIINYHCIDSPAIDDEISARLYEVVYITNYEQQNGYVVFTDRALPALLTERIKETIEK